MPDLPTIERIAQFGLPFCVVGKVPAMNVARIIETLVIAGITMLGTVQVMASKVETLVVAVNNVSSQVKAMQINDAGRSGKVEGELAMQAKINQDQEERIRKLEQRR